MLGLQHLHQAPAVAAAAIPPLAAEGSAVAVDVTFHDCLPYPTERPLCFYETKLPYALFARYLLNGVIVEMGMG